MYGFVMMAKGRTISFYVDSLEERESWVKAFRLIVIQLNPKEDYAFSPDILGKGNFAKVHLCKRKSNPD